MRKTSEFCEILKQIFEQALDAVLIADDDGRYIECNQAAESLFGYTREELLKLSFDSIVEKKEEASRLWQSLRKKGVVERDQLFIGKNRKPLLVRYRGVANLLPGMFVSFFSGDISAAKAAQNALLKSEAKFRDYVDSAPDGIFVTDETGAFLDVNKAASRITGYTDEELMSMNVEQLYPDSERNEMLDKLNQLQTHNRISMELPFLHKNGQVRFWSVEVVAMPENRFLSFAKDITERKRIEQDLIESQRNLAKAQQVAHVGNWHYDLVKDKIEWSDEMYRIYECESDTVPSMELINRLIHPKDRHILDEAFKRVFEGEPPAFIEYRIVCPTGKIKHVIGRAEITVSENGRIEKMFGIMQDVTPMREMEEQLRNSEKLNAIGQLAGGIAHDYNNQLAGIVGFADMLRDELENEPICRAYVENILAAAKRSAELTKQLLAFARKGNYYNISCDLHEIIKKSLFLLEPSHLRSITVDFRLDADDSVVFGDPNQLQSAVYNLVRNGCEAMVRGGRLLIATDTVFYDTPTVVNGTQLSAGKYVCVSIEDEGAGIPTSIIPRIFEPFFTTKPQGKGSGMGLAAVYGIVNMHKGAIGVQTAEAQGTSIFVYLPLEQEQQNEKTDNRRQEDKLSSKLKVMVVDDEPIVRDVGQAILERFGYEVITCQSGDEAISVYEKQWPQIDLVLLDIMMPGRSGQDTFVQLKKINTELKVLLSSGHSVDGMAQQMLNDGASAFIQKPFRKNELRDKIDTVLSRK